MRKAIQFFMGLTFSLLLLGSAQSEAKSLEKAEELHEQSWLSLAQKYDNPYFTKTTETPLSTRMLANWWDTLGDQTLSDLIRLALKNNRDMMTARAKVREARAALGISKANLLPWLDGNANAQRNKLSENAIMPFGIYNDYKLGIDASWEIDIFGGKRQNVKASHADLQAQYAQLHATWVSLSAEVAVNYLSLRTLQERLRLAEDSLILQEESLLLLQSRFAAGLIDYLPVSQAIYTLEQTSASIPPLKESIEQTTNLLAVLVGEIPGSLEQTLDQPTPLPQVQVANLIGIPADGLRQRPDIYVAERQLAAQIARKKAAKADRWPKFSLFGSIGLESIHSGSLFSSNSRTFSIGPSITLPIFHGGAIRKNIQVQSAREEQALANYEETVLNAVAEVRNALVSTIQENQRNLSLKTGMEAANLALMVSRDRYNSGLSDFQNVIDAQRSLLSLQDQHATSQGQMLANLVGVYKAFGGGWAPLSIDELEISEKTKGQKTND